MDFFLRDGDEQKARGAEMLDDLDLVTGRQGQLVAVAQKDGRHVCWQCGDLFDGDVSKLRPTEVKLGTAYVLLHAQCINPKIKSYASFTDRVRGLQARRFFAKAVKPFLGKSEK